MTLKYLDYRILFKETRPTTQLLYNITEHITLKPTIESC